MLNKSSPIEARKQAQREKFFSAWGNINEDIKIDLSTVAVSTSTILDHATIEQKSDSSACMVAIESIEFIELIEPASFDNDVDLESESILFD